MQSAAAEWRRRAAVQLSSGWGRNLHLFAFVGLAFAGNQEWSSQKEKDNLFAKIRELHTMKNQSDGNVETINLGCLEFGNLIDKGCSAAVYEARFITETDAGMEDIEGCDTDSELSIVSIVETDSDISILDEDGSTADPITNERIKDSTSPAEDLVMEDSDHELMLLDDVETDSDISIIDEKSESNEGVEMPKEYNLAVKMMFNYDAESNTEAVLRAMGKESVPVCLAALYEEENNWQNGNRVKKKAKASHPNIVCMYGVFVDSVPDLPDNIQHYPAALPPRIYNQGFGRNTTMFLIMKRYDCTLTDYLSRENPSMFTRCLLFGQLLEGIRFLSSMRIAHRDLKSDNLLLDLSAGIECPVLVISDFGCCLCEEGLQIPYVTVEISKGGNAALMAPEIACAEVGPKSVLDYTKSDVWAAGALAYEIFGLENPFYRGKRKSFRLDSRSYYEEDLPTLPADVPDVVKQLIQRLLCRDSRKRLGADVAATVTQMFLWGPHEWKENGSNGVNNKAAQDWAVNMAAEQACQRNARLSGIEEIRDTMLKTFLSRVLYKDIQNAVTFFNE